MKRIILISSIVLLLISACVPTATPTEQALSPIDDSSSEFSPAQRAAITRLSTTLGLPPGQISMISTDAVEWPDGCLGVQRDGVVCTLAIVPGYKILLQVNGVTYEARTNESGTQVVIVDDKPAVLGTTEEIVVAQLASNLGLDEKEITVKSSSEVKFPDACMGVVIFDVACAEGITPGKVIVLEHAGLEFEYHVNEDGTIIQPATFALTWKREGGIAGFCNGLTVFLSGEVYGSDCRSNPNEARMAFSSLITPVEQKQFFEWTREIESLSVDASDPEGVADRMVVTMEFFGIGSVSASDDDQRALFEFAEMLYNKLYS